MTNKERKKIEKKRVRLSDEIERLEHEMKLNLGQKTSSTAEISISEYLTKINKLRFELALIA